MCISILGKVVAISGVRADVDVNGQTRSVLLSVNGVRIGQWVLINSGIAIGIIDDKTAEQMRRLLDQIS